MWQHVVLCRSSVARSALQAVNVFNNVILARNRQLPDDDGMIETCRSICKSFNVNNLSVCVGWCVDQVTLRSARCNDKEDLTNISVLSYSVKDLPPFCGTLLFIAFFFFLQQSAIGPCSELDKSSSRPPNLFI